MYFYFFVVIDNVFVCVRVLFCCCWYKMVVWFVLVYYRMLNEEGFVSVRLIFYWFYFYMYLCM